MAINLRTPQAETRDQRLGTITQWEGGAAELARDSAFTYGCGRDCGPGGGRLCELSSPYSQASMCAEQIAVTNATIIKDSGGHPARADRLRRRASPSPPAIRATSRRGAAGSPRTRSRSAPISANGTWCSAASSRLADAIVQAFERHSPRVIFVATSCATGVIGDDVDGTARQARGGDRHSGRAAPLRGLQVAPLVVGLGRDRARHSAPPRAAPAEREARRPPQRHPPRRPGRVLAAGQSARPQGQSGDGRQFARAPRGPVDRGGDRHHVLRPVLSGDRARAGIRRSRDPRAPALRARRHRQLAARHRPRHEARGSGRSGDRLGTRPHRAGTGTAAQGAQGQERASSPPAPPSPTGSSPTCGNSASPSTTPSRSTTTLRPTAAIRSRIRWGISSRRPATSRISP